MSFRAETRPPVVNIFFCPKNKIKKFHKGFGRFCDLHQRNSRGLWKRPLSGWAENGGAAHLTTRQRFAFGHLLEPREAGFLDAFSLPKDPLRQLMQVRAKVPRKGTNDAHSLPSHRQKVVPIATTASITPGGFR